MKLNQRFLRVSALWIFLLMGPLIAEVHAESPGLFDRLLGRDAAKEKTETAEAAQGNTEEPAEFW